MKTVLDAVNDLKADISNQWGNGKIVSDELFKCINDDDYLTMRTGHYSNDVYHVCSVEEFNQCVEDCSNNFGKKTLYTQAMKEAGELPSVGMECIFKKRGAQEKGVVTAITNRFIIFTDTFGDEHVRKVDECTIEPIIPPIKLIDCKPYQFNFADDKVMYGIYNSHRNIFSIEQGTYFDFNRVYNIKLLEVK